VDPAITSVRFNSRSVPILTVGPCTTGDDIASALQLPALRGLIIVNGGTTKPPPELDARLRVLIGEGLIPLVVDRHLALLTGGTDSGIFAIVGQSLAHQRVSHPCIGVAPSRLVTWQGRDDGSSDKSSLPDAIPLEPHHSHFVLVEGENWGDETGVMLDLAAALGRRMPSVAVLAGGGAVTKREILEHVRQRRTIILLAGTGRFADELAGAVQSHAESSDVVVAEIVRDGHLVLEDVWQPPSAFGAAIAKALRLPLREN
jgi:SLOG in TRPM, prokaryote